MHPTRPGRQTKCGATAGHAGGAAGKTCFDDVYDQPDPRAYFARLAPLEYEIPHHAQAVFRRTVAERAAAASSGQAGVAVLDVCCSYGINAALLNHELTLAELFEHYTSPAARRVTSAEIIEWDKEFYAARRRLGAPRIIGLDVARNAVGYARAVGLLDAAYAENLEQHSASPPLRRTMTEVGLITMTGGGSYITRRTFAALLQHARRPVWVSSFVLRTISYAPVIACLSEFGLTTRADPARTYPQRLFTDPREQQHAIEAVQHHGRDPAGRELEGRYHATLYDSRPALPSTPPTTIPSAIRRSLSRRTSQDG